jgi:hypothetical protein
MGRQREMEDAFVRTVASAREFEVEEILRQAAEDPEDRARRTLARRLLEGLEAVGRGEMLRRAENHRLKISVWR